MCSSNEVTWLTAQLRCLYTSAHSMDTKQEALEATMLLASYELDALTETRTNPITEERLLMATGCSEGTGYDRGVEVFPSPSRNQ